MTDENHNLPVGPRRDAAAPVEIASNRAFAEVQAAIVMAKKAPRSEEYAIQRILGACRRRGLAEKAMYAYPRGGTTVEGPSIRLAEVLAQSWGNVDFGIVELEQRKGESQMMAYCWDLETNVRQTRIFHVPHKRYTRKGTTSLSDPRDIYEMTANQGARRLRACILGIIPGDVQESAIKQINQTLRGGDDRPIAERVEEMAGKFSEYGVTKEHLEKRLGHVLDKTSENELVNLGRIFLTLRDNFGEAADFFDMTPSAEDRAANLQERLKGKPEEKPGEPKPEEPTPSVGEYGEAADSGQKELWALLEKATGTDNPVECENLLFQVADTIQLDSLHGAKLAAAIMEVQRRISEKGEGGEAVEGKPKGRKKQGKPKNKGELF